MSGLHLNHKVSWSSLKEHFAVYKDNGVELPICSYGLIHITKKDQQRKVDQRSYLKDKVCTSLTCEVTKSRVFRKEGIKGYTLERPRGRILKESKELSIFIENFKQEIREFAKTERMKREPGMKIKNAKEIRQSLIDNSAWPKDLEGYDVHCYCRTVTLLIELGDSKTLLSMDRKDISSVLGCQHGGQAVGNNINFLTHYVLKIYFATNLIYALNLQDTPDKWGSLDPKKTYNARSLVSYDCDGQTFLYFSRKYLADEVYMKDFEAMRQLCKNCFQFLYFVEMLWMEIQESDPNSRVRLLSDTVEESLADLLCN